MTKDSKRQRFRGSWPDRLGGLFECGVDYEGKSVLDVGCNLGIVAYEISKEAPSRIDGMDRHVPSIECARLIFAAVPIESRFEAFDLLDLPAVEGFVNGSYDVVLFLAVHHHLARLDGDKADSVARHLFKHCNETVLFRGKTEEAVVAIAEEQGFLPTWREERRLISPLIRFDRQRH